MNQGNNIRYCKTCYKEMQGENLNFCPHCGAPINVKIYKNEMNETSQVEMIKFKKKSMIALSISLINIAVLFPILFWIYSVTAFFAIFFPGYVVMPFITGGYVLASITAVIAFSINGFCGWKYYSRCKLAVEIAFVLGLFLGVSIVKLLV